MDFIKANELLKDTYGRPTTVEDITKLLGNSIYSLNEKEALKRVSKVGVDIIIKDINK